MYKKLIATIITILYITISSPIHASILYFPHSKNNLSNDVKIIYFENKYCINKPCDYLKAEIKKEVETEENENEFINILKSSTKEASGLLYLPLLPLSVVMMPIMFVATWGIAFFTVNTNDELGLLRWIKTNLTYKKT